MTTQPEALRLADALDRNGYDAEKARNMNQAAAELRRLQTENAEWKQRAANWMASPEAAQRLDGYRELAQRLNAAEEKNAELLTVLKWLKNFLGGKHMPECVSRIHDAIAKAEDK